MTMAATLRLLFSQKTELKINLYSVTHAEFLAKEVRQLSFISTSS